MIPPIPPPTPKHTTRTSSNQIPPRTHSSPLLERCRAVGRRSVVRPSSLSLTVTPPRRRRTTNPRSPMALAGRLRSSIPLATRALDRSLANPALAPTEGLRNFATQTKAPETKIKVPLALFGGSGNYASALFIAASKANVLDKVESEILDIVAASKKSPLFSKFIMDLSVPKKTRVKAINSIFADAGFTDVTKNFLAVLADNGRLRNIERISKRFVELTMAHKGETHVTVTTVIPLPEAEEKELVQTLKDILGQNTVKIQQKIDPSILGGLVIEFGQKVLDMSIRTRAKQMERFLREPVNFDHM